MPRVALAGLLALAAAMGIGRFAFTPLLPMMQQDGVITLAQGGWLAAANYAGYFAGALSAMFVRIRPSAAIRGSLAAIAATTFTMALGANLWLWMANRFVAGLASAWVLVFASASTLERLAVLGRPAWGGLVFSGVGTGILVAGLACLVLLQHGADAAEAWLWLGAIAVVFTIFAWPSFGDSPAPVRTQRPRFGGDGFLRTTLCYGALGFGYIVPATFLPAMARDAMPDPAAFGWIWPIFGLAAASSTLAAAALARATGYRALWIGANVAMAIGVALPVASAKPTALLASGVLVGGTFMVITMAGLQEARRIGGSRARELIAAMTCAFAFGQIAGPLVVSALAVRGLGYSFALSAAASALLFSAVALVPWRKR